MNKPIINGPSPIPSINQDSRTYTIANNTNATDFLWSVNNGSTIAGSSTGTSVVVQPPLCGTFTVTCAVKRSAANNNYVYRVLKQLPEMNFKRQLQLLAMLISAHYLRQLIQFLIWVQTQ